ncbi:hypothetical protein BDZ94DRAFT_1241908 [Collybia nuda]|uniref:Uncharacterized protein n=1 Tax=Collybia nuda TaxID=64659 RepID=A0A9P6C878_9AGAR|nr:hypothetical protein BDZ94DRAFT_1241908 [Collybia nuda]
MFAQPGGEVVAVDALGKVLKVAGEDVVGILGLAGAVLRLPETGVFRNMWRVKWNSMCQRIYRIFIADPAPRADVLEGEKVDEEGDKDVGKDVDADPEPLDHFAQVSFQGFSKTNRKLAEPVGEITELPDPLWELAGLVLEGQGWAGRDEVVLGRVWTTIAIVILILVINYELMIFNNIELYKPIAP